jgi:hypothetical protein
MEIWSSRFEESIATFEMPTRTGQIKLWDTGSVKFSYNKDILIFLPMSNPWMLQPLTDDFMI